MWGFVGDGEALGGPSQVGFELRGFCGAAAEGRGMEVHVSTERPRKEGTIQCAGRWGNDWQLSLWTFPLTLLRGSWQEKLLIVIR